MLMRSAMVTSGAITQRLDRLEARRPDHPYAERGRRRVVIVALTEDGLALIDRALPDHVATEERLLAALAPAERDALARTLRVLLESLGDSTD